MSLSLCACEGSDIKHMMIASDSLETQNNDAVTKMQTIHWCGTTIAVYYFYCRMPQIQAAVNCLGWRILDIHSPVILCSFVSWCDYVSFWPSYPNFTLTTKAHTFIHWELPTFQCDCWHQLNQHISHFDTLPVSCGSFKGIVHFEIKIWYLSAYPKGIQDVGVFFSSVDPILMFLGQTVLVCQSYNGRYRLLSL